MYTEIAVESHDSVCEVIRTAASSLGYAEIRLVQETAVRAFVTESDVLSSIPTGGDKSLCYAVLPRVFGMLWGNDTSQSLVIVVSPLVAYMDERSIRARIARIARLHFLLVTLQRDVTRMKFQIAGNSNQMFPFPATSGRARL